MLYNFNISYELGSSLVSDQTINYSYVSVDVGSYTQALYVHIITDIQYSAYMRNNKMSNLTQPL